MTLPKLPMIDEIGQALIEQLQDDDQFSEELLQKLASLFKSGDIADSSNVVSLLRGASGEDCQSGN